MAFSSFFGSSTGVSTGFSSGFSSGSVLLDPAPAPSGGIGTTGTLTGGFDGSAFDRGFFGTGAAAESFFTIDIDGVLTFTSGSLAGSGFLSEPLFTGGLFDPVPPFAESPEPPLVIARPTPNGSVLVGTFEGERLVGGGEGDLIDGEGGNDLLIGGAGEDLLLGGSGDDQLFGDADADAMLGEAGNDALRGGAGADALFGGSGNDLLFGEAGDDALFGDAGADLFVFSPLGGRDVIVDFDPVEGDRIGLDSTVRAVVGSNGAGEAVITFSDDDSVTLAGVSARDVGADWFVLL